MRSRFTYILFFGLAGRAGEEFVLASAAYLVGAAQFHVIIYE